MQGYLCEVLENGEELASQPQIDRLISSIGKLTDRTDSLLVKLESKPQTMNENSKGSNRGWLESLKSAWTVISILILGVAGAGWKLHDEFTQRDESINRVEKHMASLQMAIKVLGDAQGGKTKELVDDALAISKLDIDTGHSIEARSAVSVATTLTAELKSSKVPADPKFFAESVNKFRGVGSYSSGEPKLTDAAFEGILQLAEYRSALTSQPENFHAKYEYKVTKNNLSIGHMEFINGHGKISDTIIYGNALALGELGGISIDGLELENVVFNGTNIRYRGGFVIMKNVWFINCTFQVPQSVRGTEFLESAALGQTTKSLG
jgi:hypothetical protein